MADQKETAEVKQEPVEREPEDFSYLNEDTQSKAAPAAVPPVSQTVSVPSHPAPLVEAARGIGIRESVIASLSTDDLIAHTLDLQRKMSVLETGDARRAREPEPRQVKAAEPVSDDDSILDYMEKEVGADPKLVNLLRKRFQKQDQLEKQLRERDEFDTVRRQSSGEEAVDSAFEHLGPKFEKLFGTGGLRSLENAAQKAKRLAVFRSANIDFQADSERTIERKITKAAMEVYGDVLPEAEPKNAYEQPKPNGKYTAEEFARGGLAMPTATKPAKSKGRKAAEEAIRERMQEWGVGTASIDDEFEGLPN